MKLFLILIIVFLTLGLLENNLTITELQKMNANQAQHLQDDYKEIHRTYGIITSGHCDEIARAAERKK